MRDEFWVDDVCSWLSRFNLQSVEDSTLEAWARHAMILLDNRCMKITEIILKNGGRSWEMIVSFEVPKGKAGKIGQSLRSVL